MSSLVLAMILTLLTISLFLWAVANFPGDPAVKQMVRVIAVVLCGLWLLSLLANFLGLTTFPRVRW